MTRGKNLTRMLALIDEVFATRNDPDQLQVTPAQQEKLSLIHPSTLSEYADENGPAIWVLLIPTTKTVMKDFVNGTISESELLDRTTPGTKYDCIYLCSATTLPEYRGKGKTKALCIKAIRRIGTDHPIRHLFVWPFTAAGEKLAEAVASQTGLLLHKRQETS